MRTRLRQVAEVVLLVVALAPGGALAETGVTDTELRIGEASAFSGPSAGLGIEQWRGAQAAFSAANDAGGVHGRKVVYLVADDGYDAEKAAPAVFQLIAKDRVFALFGGVGTPTIVKSLPVLLKFHKSEGLFRFANFTGAQPQREPPYDKAVFNVRASYRQETRAMVDAFVAMGVKRVGLFVQDDAYGASGRDGVRLALEAHGLKLAADTSYPRGQKFGATTSAQVALLKDAGVEAVISVGAYQACAALVRDVRATGWSVPIHNVSFVGADQMLRLLKGEANPRVLENLLVTQVVPPYSEGALPLVKEYRAAMDRYAPTAPKGVGDAAYQPESRYSFGSLEGYLNARALLSLLEKNGKELTRKSFYATVEAAGPLDLGLGVPLQFSPTRHQALDKVWFTYATPAGWASTDDPSKVLKR
ncbi:MAG: ABC transporter substrate-binding protein [Myxococcaceae bacterium]